MCTELSKNQLLVLVVLSRGPQPACSWKQVWRGTRLRCPLLSWAGLRPVFTFKQDLCASWLLAQWNPLQTEVWAFHLLLLLHFKWTLIGTFDMNSIQLTMRLQITKIGFHRWPEKIFRLMLWKWCSFLTWRSLRPGIPFLDLWGKRLRCQCCQTITVEIWIRLSSHQSNVSSGLGNYKENLRFAGVPRLKGESKATPQAANTLKISWEVPNRTCPPNKCNIWLLDDNLLYWRWSDSLLSPSPVHTQRRVP